MLKVPFVRRISLAQLTIAAGAFAILDQVARGWWSRRRRWWSVEGHIDFDLLPGLAVGARATVSVTREVVHALSFKNGPVDVHQAKGFKSRRRVIHPLRPNERRTVPVFAFIIVVLVRHEVHVVLIVEIERDHIANDHFIGVTVRRRSRRNVIPIRIRPVANDQFLRT